MIFIVQLPIEISHPHLVCHLMLHVSLYPPQHEWLQYHVQPRQLAFIKSRLLLGMALNVAREPLVELFMRVKHGGHDEVKQRPELLHCVLDRSTGQEQSVATVEAEQHPPSNTAHV